MGDSEAYIRMRQALPPEWLAEFDETPGGRRPEIRFNPLRNYGYYGCDVCGALLLTPGIHAEWHVRLNLKMFVALKLTDFANDRIGDLAGVLAEFADSAVKDSGSRHV